MKISNETKVGLLTLVALVLLILGFNYLKGNNILNRSKKLYAVFPAASSLEKSNPVKVKGLDIGTVYQKDPVDKNVSGIVITLNWTKDINIPDDSYAFINSPLVGTSYIDIHLGSSTNYLKDGDTLKTKLNAGLLGDLTSQVNPTLEKARTAIDSLTIVLGSINKIFDPNTKGNIQGIIANLMITSASLQQMLNSQTGVIAGTLNNLNDVSGNLKKNNDTINHILSNVNQTTANLARLNFEKTLDSVQQAVNHVNDIVRKVNTNQGSLGLLMNDKQLYDNLQKAALGLEILIDDLRLHPKRYVNISVFGKKDKGNYLTSPAEKDTIIVIDK